MRANEFIIESITAYHGTFGDWKGEFRHSSSWEDIGFHFGSKEAAKNRLSLKQREMGKQLDNPNIRKFRLNLNKPLRMGEQKSSIGRPGDGSWTVNRVWMEISNAIWDDKPLFPLTEQEYNAILEETFDELVNSTGESYDDAYGHSEREWIIQWLNDKGYDGIVYKNEYEHGGDSYIVFHTNQIKRIE